MRVNRSPIAVLCVALAAALAFPVLGATATAATDYTVSIASTSRNVTLGSTFVASGDVFPIAAGTTLRVQSRQPGTTTWTTVKTTRVTTQSKYSVTIKQAYAGVTGYRVVKPAGNGHGQGISPELKVTGWRWKSFATIDRVDAINAGKMTFHKTVTINGKKFSSSFTQTPDDLLSAVAQFDLGGRCAKVDTWVGGDSTSAGTTSETAAISDSDVPLATKVVAKKKAAQHVVLGPDVVKQIQTITFQLSGLEAGNKVSWGALRAYCKF
ncbi:MAG: hypothetical protein JWQ74_164 [Marmoricola sp.]|nr:hypothetical protein [Marmoricola sp.]